MSWKSSSAFLQLLQLKLILQNLPSKGIRRGLNVSLMADTGSWRMLILGKGLSQRYVVNHNPGQHQPLQVTMGMTHWFTAHCGSMGLDIKALWKLWEIENDRNEGHRLTIHQTCHKKRTECFWIVLTSNECNHSPILCCMYIKKIELNSWMIEAQLDL